MTDGSIDGNMEIPPTVGTPESSENLPEKPQPQEVLATEDQKPGKVYGTAKVQETYHTSPNCHIVTSARESRQGKVFEYNSEEEAVNDGIHRMCRYCITGIRTIRKIMRPHKYFWTDEKKIGPNGEIIRTGSRMRISAEQLRSLRILMERCGESDSIGFKEWAILRERAMSSSFQVLEYLKEYGLATHDMGKGLKYSVRKTIRPTDLGREIVNSTKDEIIDEADLHKYKVYVKPKKKCISDDKISD